MNTKKPAKLTNIILIAALSVVVGVGGFVLPATVYAEEEPAETAEPVAPETPEQPEEPKPEKPKPKAPKAKVSVKGKGLIVKRKKQEGIKSYKVYRSYKKSSGYKLLKKGIKGSSYKDEKVKSGKKAYYKVRACLKGGGTKTSKPASGVIYRVYIETGHGINRKGKWDPGCKWNGWQEAKLMIPICKSATKYLRERGVFVYTDAFSGNNLNLKKTIIKVKKLDVSVFLNVHCDYQRAPKGTLPLYRYGDQKELAKCLNKGVHKYVKIRDRGLKKRKDLRSLNEVRGSCVSCLYETGNIKKDNKLLRKKSDAFGKGLAKGVCDYLGVEW